METSSSSSTRLREDYLPKRQDSSTSSTSNKSNSIPMRPAKSTRRIATDRRNKLTTAVNNGNSINGNGKGKESDEDILRREVEMEWINSRRERGIEDGRISFDNEYNNNGTTTTTSTSSSPNSSRRNTNSSRTTAALNLSGSSISRGKRRKMTIGEDEKVIIKPRPISISSIASSSDGNSIYEDARDYFDDSKVEYRDEYELGGTRPLFSLLPSPFSNSSTSRRPSTTTRSPRQNYEQQLYSTNQNKPNKRSSTSTSSTGSSPLLTTIDLNSNLTLKDNLSRRSWTPKPLVLTPARTVAIPLTSPRPISSQGFHLSNSTGSNNSRPLSPLLTTSELRDRRGSMTNSPTSRPGSAMSYIVNSPISDNGSTNTGTNRRRKSIGYFDSGIASVLNSSLGRNGSSSNNCTTNGRGRNNRDSTSSSTGYYNNTDMRRSGSSDHSEERESPDSSYDVWEEGERNEFVENNSITAKISDILEVVEEVSGLWKEEQDDDDEDEGEDYYQEIEEESNNNPLIHLSLPSPIQNKILSTSTTSTSSYSHSLATLDETSPHRLEQPSSIALEPPTPPPPFPLPVLPKSLSQQQQSLLSLQQQQQQLQQQSPQSQDEKYFSNYSDFLQKTRGSGTRSVQSNEVYDAYWDANTAAARLSRADSSNYGSEDGSTRSRIRNGAVGGEFLNTAAAIARRNTLNRGFPPPSPPSSHSGDSSIDSTRSSQYDNALEEQTKVVLKIEDLLDGLTPKVLRIKTSTSQTMIRNQSTVTITSPITTPRDFNITTTDLDYPTPSPPSTMVTSPTERDFSETSNFNLDDDYDNRMNKNNLNDLSNFWPPLDDGKTKVISLSPRLEALSLEVNNNSKLSVNNNNGDRNLKHQISLSSSTGSKRWSSTPFSSMLPNKHNRRDSSSTKLSKSTTSSRMVLCIPLGVKGPNKNNEEAKRGLDVFGVNEDDEDLNSIRNGSIGSSSNGSIIIRGGKKFSIGASIGSKKLFSFSKKSKTSLRSGSPSPSAISTPSTNLNTGLGISNNSNHNFNSNDWNGRTTVIASSPPVIPSLTSLTVDRKVETWTSSPASISSRYMDNVLEVNESTPVKRFSNGGSYSDRRPVPSYYLPPLSSNDSINLLPTSPPRIKSYLNTSTTTSNSSPTSLAVATVLVQGPPSPRIPAPHFQLPMNDQAPILPHIRKDSDPFDQDLKMLNLSQSASSISISTVSTTNHVPTSSNSPSSAPTQAVLLQHTFPALRGSNNSPHSKSTILPVRKVKVLEMNPTRVTFRANR